MNMNNTNTKTVRRDTRGGWQSPLYRDLAAATPASASRFTPSNKNVFSTPAQAAAATALWKDSFGGSDPPPPPVLTLEDRVELFPDIMTPGDRYYSMASPEAKSSSPKMYLVGTGTPGASTPIRNNINNIRSSLGNAHIETTNQSLVSPYSLTPGIQGAQQNQAPGINLNWWSTVNDNSGDGGERGGRVSPVSGVVQQQQQSGGLLMLPPAREIARPDIQTSGLSNRVSDEEEWVTVFGFSPSDTNLVLREFGKCGIILKHVPGPGEANWMHILYESRYDAQNALQKNGMQINGILIIGVKPLDPQQRQALIEKANYGFMISPPQSCSRAFALPPSKNAVSRPYYLQSSETSQRATGAMASPSKSTISKIVDLMFGI
jgi:nuclear pore complex protein Nup53